MADRNELEPICEPDIETGEACENCQVPETANCQSCGMPMMSPEQHGGGDEENGYCVHCCTPDGRLKSYGEVLEGMVGLMISNRGLDRAAAEKAAGEYLATTSAWSSR